MGMAGEKWESDLALRTNASYSNINVHGLSISSTWQLATKPCVQPLPLYEAEPC